MTAVEIASCVRARWVPARAIVLPKLSLARSVSSSIDPPASEIPPQAARPETARHVEQFASAPPKCSCVSPVIDPRTAQRY